jgi:hypothetical protein
MTTQNSNLSNPQKQEPTRREFLQALAILPAAVVLPALPEVITQAAPTTEAPAIVEALGIAEAHIKQLMDFTIKQMDFQAYLYGVTRFGKPVNPIELFERWSEAIRTSDALSRFLLEDFDESLRALCGSYETYRAGLDEWEKMYQA